MKTAHLTTSHETGYARTLDATFCAHPCPVDGRSCEVIEPFADLLRAELGFCADGGDASDELITGAAVQEGREGHMPRATADVLRELPCERCRSVEAQVESLKHLGRLERRILLAAPPPEEPARHVEPEWPSRAAASAHQRAMRSLARAGLLQLGWCQTEVKADFSPWPRRVRKRSVRLSQLGYAVVQRSGTDLQGTRRIRWTRHRAALIAVARLPLSELLLLVHDRIAARAERSLELAEAMEVFGRHEEAAAARTTATALDAVWRAIEIGCGIPKDPGHRAAQEQGGAEVIVKRNAGRSPTTQSSATTCLRSESVQCSGPGLTTLKVPTTRLSN